MRKIFVFITLIMALCFISANAQPYQVEKASKAKANGKVITIGQTLNENVTIRIEDNGYLLFVDVNNNKRYYINTSCNNKIKKLIKKAKAPMRVTKSYLESLFTQSQEKDKYASAGSVNRGDEGEAELSDFALMDPTRGDELPDSIPAPIGIDVLTTTEETISVYYIIP